MHSEAISQILERTVWKGEVLYYIKGVCLFLVLKRNNKNEIFFLKVVAVSDASFHSPSPFLNPLLHKHADVQ
jgi:hypothetical protein